MQFIRFDDAGKWSKHDLIGFTLDRNVLLVSKLCRLFSFLFFFIQKEQTENKKLQKRVEEMERAVRGMEDKFE